MPCHNNKKIRCLCTCLNLENNHILRNLLAIIKTSKLIILLYTSLEVYTVFCIDPTITFVSRFFSLYKINYSSLPVLIGFIVGNNKTSLIVEAFVKNITSLSIPIPIPPVGGIPYSRAVRKSSSIIFASSSP